MTAFRTSRNNPIALPYEGMDLTTPLPNLPTTRAPWIENFFINGQTMRVRNGSDVYSLITGGANLSGQGVYNDANFFGDQTIPFCVDSAAQSIYDVSTNPATLVYNNALLIFGNIFIRFKQYLYLVGAGCNKLAYDGTNWAPSGFTYTATVGDLAAGNGYRNRMYFVEDGTTLAWYGGVNSTSGALTSFDVGSQFSRGGVLFNIFPVSFGSSNSSIKYLAFVSTEGEVVYYTGAYPESADWQVVATLEVGKPKDGARGVFVFYQGDTILPTSTGLVSLRDLLLTNNSDAIYQPLSYAIDSYWRQLYTINYALGDTTGANSIVYFKRTNSIYIYFPRSLARENNNLIPAPPVGSTFGPQILFVYNTVIKTWTYYTLLGAQQFTGNLIDYNNRLLMTFETNSKIGVIEIEKDNLFADRNPDTLALTSITGNILSSAFVNPNAGGTIKNDVISLYSYLGASSQSIMCNLLENFGTGQTPNTRPKVIINRFNESRMSIGSVAPYVQYNLSVETNADTGQPSTLYAINVLNESGGFG